MQVYKVNKKMQFIFYMVGMLITYIAFYIFLALLRDRDLNIWGHVKLGLLMSSLLSFTVIQFESFTRTFAYRVDHSKLHFVDYFGRSNSYDLGDLYSIKRITFLGVSLLILSFSKKELKVFVPGLSKDVGKFLNYIGKHG